ncbi:MAG TPA: HNH endonuclease [Methylomirabilota bacterium]|nr:HNH endonuclease [Methylomirabilota bacterium]
MPRNADWTREQLILAFNLYCKIPFGTIHQSNPKLIELGRFIKRTPGAVSYKLANFSRLDPEHQARGIRGAAHGSKGEEEIWREFYSNPEQLAYESEVLLARFRDQRVEDVAGIDEQDLPKEGLERERLVRMRVNQHFFRTAVLAAYDRQCCITGLAVPELLVASHIIPWAQEPAQRMNPRNGLCLNALHDRAFDRRLLWFDDDLRVRLSPAIRTSAKATTDQPGDGLALLLASEGKRLREPRRFSADRELLRQHARSCESALGTLRAMHRVSGRADAHDNPGAG